MKGAPSAAGRLLSGLVLLAGLPCSARADLIQLVSPGELTGPGRTTVEYTSTQDLLPSPLVVTFPDNTVTLTLATGQWRRADQSVNFWGDFNPGTRLLYTNNNNFLAFDGVTTVGGGGSGPVQIDFALGVQLAGLRAQTDMPGPEAFTFSAYNGPALLGTFTVNGVSGQRSDEQFLVVLGARATQGDVITRLVISSLAFQGGGVHANRFVMGPVSYGTVPEPAAGTLVVVVMIAAGSRLRRRS